LKFIQFQNGFPKEYFFDKFVLFIVFIQHNEYVFQTSMNFFRMSNTKNEKSLHETDFGYSNVFPQDGSCCYY